MSELSDRADPADETASRLRAALVDELSGDRGVVRDSRVIEAIRAVPRHVFVPEATIAEAYENQPIVTKKDADGLGVSSISQPTIVAVMLAQLDVVSGHRVLEIGAGTGYNAALLRHLVGPDGAVTTVDIDVDIVERAQRGLAAAGCADVGVHVADGWNGWVEDAPYDRIILTVGAADLAPAWWDQLVEGGLLVLPLQLLGGQRSVAFERTGDHWTSRSATPCGFIPMRGVGASLPRSVSIDTDGPALWVLPDQPVDADALRAAFAMPGEVNRLGVRAAIGELYDLVGLYLGLLLDGYGRLGMRGQHERFAPALSWGSPALVGADSFAYLSKEDQDDEADEFELSVRGHGPHGPELAARLAAAIHAWDRDRTAYSAPTIRAYPAGTSDARLPAGRVVDTANARVVVGWGET